MNIKIQMVDLKSQHVRIKSEIDNAIHDVIESSVFIKGQEVASFENELANYLGVKHVIGCGNGTDAIQIALMALGLEKGDEVIVPAFTYPAAIEVILLLGLKPIMVDIDIQSYNLDVSKIESKITSRTKVIIPVHLFGQSAEMESIVHIAQKYNLFIIEDNAQSLGALYTFSNGDKKRTGTIGHIGTTSFFPSKNLGCMGDGGAIMTNDDELARKIRMIANHGQRELYVHEMIGVNSRLDSLQAAILRVKLKHLDSYENKRNEAAQYYDSYFANNEELMIPTRGAYSSHVFHQYTISLSKKVDRNKLRKYMLEKGIQTMIYYPTVACNQLAYSSENNNSLDFPMSELATQTVISLPIHTEMNETLLMEICTTLTEGLRAQGLS
ncbi:MAG: DegT/DnrJ/EryC1/StrS family aminotransferase [Bacteroidetes bacterium]|nr:DegT/DnrJ/EryC1/StrS family aminotransferase [Bacteroidota bacterium]